MCLKCGSESEVSFLWQMAIIYVNQILSINVFDYLALDLSWNTIINRVLECMCINTLLPCSRMLHHRPCINYTRFKANPMNNNKHPEYLVNAWYIDSHSYHSILIHSEAQIEANFKVSLLLRFLSKNADSNPTICWV